MTAGGATRSTPQRLFAMESSNEEGSWMWSCQVLRRPQRSNNSGEVCGLSSADAGACPKWQ